MRDRRADRGATNLTRDENLDSHPRILDSRVRSPSRLSARPPGTINESYRL